MRQDLPSDDRTTSSPSQCVPSPSVVFTRVSSRCSFLRKELAPKSTHHSSPSRLFSTVLALTPPWHMVGPENGGAATSALSCFLPRGAARRFLEGSSYDDHIFEPCRLCKCFGTAPYLGLSSASESRDPPPPITQCRNSSSVPQITDPSLT